MENKCHLYPNLSRQPAGILLCRRRPEICGLAEFQPELLLSRPEIYSKPAWGLGGRIKRLGEGETVGKEHESEFQKDDDEVEGDVEEVKLGMKVEEVD